MFKGKKGKQFTICGTLVISVVLIAAASSTLFLNAEAESQDWDVNDDGNCNLLDINQVPYHINFNIPSDINKYDIDNNGMVNQHDVQLMESHCDWQSGSPSGSGSFAITNVTVVAPSQKVPVGKSFTISIFCTPGEPIRAFQFNLGFNASLLQANSVTNVAKIFEDGGYGVFSSNGDIDNSAGSITDVYAAITGPGSVNDAGKFATIEFIAEDNAGISDLNLYNVIVLNETGVPVSLALNNGTVTIGGLWVDAGGPYQSELGESIQFTGSVVSGGTPPYTWNWDFGDGSTSTEQNPVYVYSEENVHMVTLTVEDDAGKTGTNTTTATTTIYGRPDLLCRGTTFITRTDLKPGATVTDSFTVLNVGDPETLLNWEVSEYPDWGTWTVTPNNGSIKRLDDPVKVDVEVEIPDEQNQGFIGQIKIINTDDSSDNELISFFLYTTKNKAVNTPFLDFLQQHPHLFPLLRLILELQ